MEKILGVHPVLLFDTLHRSFIPSKGLKTLNNLNSSLGLLGSQAAQLPTQIVVR
jgi:hypothetical protein